MKIFNKTNRKQGIRITDRYGNLYTIFLRPMGVVELEPSQVSEDVKSLLKKGTLINLSEKDMPSEEENVSIKNEEICKILSVNPVIEETSNISEKIEEVPSPKGTIEETSDLYKCEVCGNEYASLRGLNMHMNKSHPDYKKEG